MILNLREKLSGIFAGKKKQDDENGYNTWPQQPDDGTDPYDGRKVYKSKKQEAEQQAKQRAAEVNQNPVYQQPSQHHVERIVLLRSRNECKDVISYMKSNASVFLNMEFIASDNDRQRCVDMLSGAAYTLGCSLNKLSTRGMYLISSPSVQVVLDPAMQKMANAAEAQAFASRQGYAQPQRQPDPRQPLQSYQQVQGMQPPVQQSYQQTAQQQFQQAQSAQQHYQQAQPMQKPVSQTAQPGYQQSVSQTAQPSYQQPIPQNPPMQQGQRMTRQARAAQQMSGAQPTQQPNNQFATGNTPTMRFQTQAPQSMHGSFGRVMTDSEYEGR